MGSKILANLENFDLSLKYWEVGRMHNYAGKVVVITGGATGIGFAFAKAFGAEGAKVIIAEPRLNRLEEEVSALEGLGIEARHFICDVTDPAQVEALADFAWDTYGHVDILLSNAGVSAPRHKVPDMPLEEVHKVFAVNFFGVWHCAASFGRRMREQGTPSAIYNVGSENSFFSAVPQGAAYMATKHAVLALTEGLREDMPDFVTVGMIVPGWVQSELIDPRSVHLAMDADRFAGICLPQIKAGEPYVVSHAFNIEHIDARHAAVSKAYETYAPRYEGDDEYDVRTLVRKMTEARARKTQ
jgi:NAD(P)-dependent dehydrogenase (short-subunit alcohol dehydrogenase family)